MDVWRIKNSLRNRLGQIINLFSPPKFEIHSGNDELPFNLIFVTSRWGYRSRFVGDGFEYINFLYAFKKLANMIYFVPIENKQKITKTIRSFKKENKKTIVFSVFQQLKDIPKDYFKLSKEGFYLVNWYTDDDMLFDKFSKHVANLFDLNIITFKPNIKEYKLLGAKVITSQWAAKTYYPFLNERPYLACFIGRMYGGRAILAERLKKEFKELIFVHDTRKKILKESEMINAYRNSWLAIDDSIASDKKNIQIKARVFEDSSYGCLVLTKPNARILKYFKLNKEILFWNNVSELISIIKNFQKNPEEYKKLTSLAYSRVKREHLYEYRFKEIFEFISDDIS
jgi:spore maturation protein CgeB